MTSTEAHEIIYTPVLLFLDILDRLVFLVQRCMRREDVRGV